MILLAPLPLPRLYHVVSIVEKTGRKTRMTTVALPHGAACTLMRKFTQHAFRRIELEELK